MSYTIEFNHQFIRSKLGITPCWLTGSNNVTEGSGRSERVARSWSVFCNALATTEAKLIETVSPSLHGFNEHWKKNGRYLDDKALLRWIKNGCRSAASIEQIIKYNALGSVRCSLSVRTQEGVKRELDEYLSTTEAFDDWITRAKQRIADAAKDGMDAFASVIFPEKLKHPPVKTEKNKEVLLKYGKRYLRDCTDNTATWTPNIREARVFAYEEAIALQDSTFFTKVREARLVSAANKQHAYDAVIKISGGNCDGLYIAGKDNARVAVTGDISSAKHYRDAAAATMALNKFAAAAAMRGGCVSVVIDPATTA